MKKIILAAGAALFLAGCSHTKGTKVSIESTDSTAKMTTEMSKIATAVEKGESVKCILTDEKNTAMTYFMKGKKVKMTGISSTAGDAQSTAMISDGEYVYSWDEVKKEGVKFEVPEETTNDGDSMEKEDKSQMDIPDFSNPDDQQQYEDQGFSIECEVINVADSEFVPPTDVNFTDLAAMMEQMENFNY